jgi:hypothetical protein
LEVNQRNRKGVIMAQAVSESSGGALSAYPQVRWQKVVDGIHAGQIAGRLARAMVYNHGYVVTTSLTLDGHQFLKSQEFPTVAQACAAAEQWLTQIV